MTDFQFETTEIAANEPEKALIAAHEILPKSTDRLQSQNDGKTFFGEAYAPLDSVNMHGWIHQPRDPGLPLRTFVEQYTPPDAPPPVDGAQQVSLFIRGLPSSTDRETAAALHRILTDRAIDDSKAPHFIHDLNSIQGALDTTQSIPEDFSIESAWTRTIHDKRILFVEGDYLTGPKSDFREPGKALTAYIDADPKHPGQMFVTASYVASPELFNKYLPQAKRILESMRFNNKTQEAAE